MLLAANLYHSSGIFSFKTKIVYFSFAFLTPFNPHIAEKSAALTQFKNIVLVTVFGITSSEI